MSRQERADALYEISSGLEIYAKDLRKLGGDYERFGDMVMDVAADCARDCEEIEQAIAASPLAV